MCLNLSIFLPPSALFLLYIDFYTCFDVQSPMEVFYD
nr:MAG TPA: hypothetical protein [Caudoviricetes sp.]